jgi:hypothetical protein
MSASVLLAQAPSDPASVAFDVVSIRPSALLFAGLR